MVLYESDKSRVRIHFGVPVLGVQDSGFALGYRFTNVIGLLEYRMNNLQPWEYGRIVGSPVAAFAVSAPIGIAAGNTISCTVGALGNFSYTVTSADMAAEDPVFSACQNFANAFNAVNGASYVASAQPTVAWPITTRAQIGQPTWQITFISTGSTAFTIAPSSTGVVSTVTAQGAAPMPTVTFSEDNTTATGYLAICDYLQARTATASDLAKFSKADVVTFRYDEIGYREAIYRNWRQKLADYFGIPLFPMKNSGPNSKTGLVV